MKDPHDQYDFAKQGDLAFEIDQLIARLRPEARESGGIKNPALFADITGSLATALGAYLAYAEMYLPDDGTRERVIGLAKNKVDTSIALHVKVANEMRAYRAASEGELS